MAGRNRQRGFSIAEVLIAVGILGVAMIFIAGVFPVGLRFTQVSIDRTTAAIAANDAFAKVQLYANAVSEVNLAKITELSFTQQRDFNDWFDRLITMPGVDDYLVDANTFCYPTDNSIKFDDKQYCWSAFLRRADRLVSDPNILDASRDVQVTVFVCRRGAPAAQYYQPDFRVAFPSTSYGRLPTTGFTIDKLPQPVRVEVRDVPGKNNELKIIDTSEKTLINDGDLIVDDPTGRIYRVVERYKSLNDNIILLDKDFVLEDWQGQSIFGNRFVWVVPPAAPMGASKGIISNVWQVRGKSPCVAIYQKVLRL